MVTGNSDDPFADFVRVPQIITLAIAGGASVFAVIAAVSVGWPSFDPPGVLTIVALLAAAMALALRAVVPTILVNTGIGSISRGKFPSAGPTNPKQAEEFVREMQAMADASPEEARQRTTWRWQLRILFQSQLMVALGLIEGAVFFLLVVYIVEQSAWALAAAAALIFSILTLFPTRSGLADWAARQERRLEEERILQPR